MQPQTNARIGDLPVGSLIRSWRRAPTAWLIIGRADDGARVLLTNLYDALRESSLPPAAFCWHIPRAETEEL